jgi:hypothetical protein
MIKSIIIRKMKHSSSFSLGTLDEFNDSGLVGTYHNSEESDFRQIVFFENKIELANKNGHFFDIYYNDIINIEYDKDDYLCIIHSKSGIFRIKLRQYVYDEYLTDDGALLATMILNIRMWIKKLNP